MRELPEAGYRGPQVCTIVGITYRQLDYWTRTGLIRPSVAEANGSGTQRRYSFRDLVECKVIKQMLDAGIELRSARKAIESLRAYDKDLASARIVIDGSTVLLAESDDQVIDLMRRGQGVLSIVAIEPLEATVTAAVRAVAEPAPVARRAASR
ncbi:MAG: MerR family transcriptional regulator [Actinomycetota bacterium]